MHLRSPVYRVRVNMCMDLPFSESFYVLLCTSKAFNTQIIPISLSKNAHLSWKPYNTKIAAPTKKKKGESCLDAEEFFSSDQLLRLYKWLIPPCMETAATPQVGLALRNFDSWVQSNPSYQLSQSKIKSWLTCLTSQCFSFPFLRI